jgi:hypothetical protein
MKTVIYILSAALISVCLGAASSFDYMPTIITIVAGVSFLVYLIDLMRGPSGRS